jgi:crotonobetainyl-CoA:carnitine CoA-transferase CaiB-like acyl-CoA transferase
MRGVSCRWQDRAVDRRGAAWAASGAMTLTGHSDGPPLGAPPALIDLVERSAELVCASNRGGMHLDGLALLGERAAIFGFVRRGAVSCGGGSRLVRAADGWLAVSLSRPDDTAALPAWLRRDLPGGDRWPAVTEAVADLPVALLDQRAALLGLPIAAVGSVGPVEHPAFDLPVQATEVGGPRRPPRSIAGAVVIDLSALWAGPLCGQLLGSAGADVIKVESTARPDGARLGSAPFFDLLNGEKRSVKLDLATARGKDTLRLLIGAADVVIESTRPRALEQMGIDATAILGHRHGPQVWASITSHGRSPESGGRVGFGDVAAAAGGLVAGDERGPCFLADAVADPLTGLVAAAAVIEALSVGGRWMIDAAMAPMAASVAGKPFAAAGACPSAPRAREVVRPAPPLGADTDEVLAELLQ